MPETVSVERVVAAPAERVWALVSDVTRMGDWSPETVGGAWIGGASAPAEGARFRGRNRNGWHRWSTVCTVTAAEPGRSFAFRVTAGPLGVAEWAYMIEPTGQSCHVTESWTDRRGRLLRVLGKPVSGVGDRANHNRVGMTETLARLATAAEASTA